MSSSKPAIRNVESIIVTLRGQRVILDFDLATLYGVETRALNQAVKRNQERFPSAFMFQLTAKEFTGLKSQVAQPMRSQTVIASKRNVRFLPHAFTEHGALMAANVLNSSRAIQMSVALVEEFVRLRRMTLSVEGLSRKVNELEKGFHQHGRQFETVFNALRALMAAPAPTNRKIGFKVD